ncbi:MAG: helix-turn-helix domain-containing protein, partial [Sediminibacterium sp.]
FILLILLYRPIFLNRAFATISLSNLFNIKQKIVNDAAFTNYFYVHLYFINNKASIQNFANMLNVQVDDIKNYIKNIYGVSFDELIDKNRIEYFVQIAKDPKYNNLTIEALAEEVGYSSRSSFYKSFKRYHGGNPSDLIAAHNISI